MTTGTSVTPSDAGPSGASALAPEGWRELRADSDIQFEPISIPDVEPAKPGWLESFFKWLSEFFAPVGRWIGESWPFMRWILLALLIAAIAFIAWRIIEPMLTRARNGGDEPTPQWQPERSAALALLEDADRLAAEGRYDEATHLLLQRSVGQIAESRPDWFEPSSTARELAALPNLSDRARTAFSAIAEKVEASLFALRPLTRPDWDAARSAYADFALVRLDETSG